MATLVKKIILKTFKKKISLYQLTKARTLSKPIKLIIGSGYTIYKDWIATDIETLNITKAEDWGKNFNKNTISSVLAEHVFEHLSANDRDKAFENIYSYLGIGGNFRIAVPDGFHPDPEYIKYVKPGGIGLGAQDHKFLYNYISLSQILLSFGFTVKLLEYFDEFGRFHISNWDSYEGAITRSAINDNRNKNGTIKYSSLIIDAVK